MKEVTKRLEFVIAIAVCIRLFILVIGVILDNVSDHWKYTDIDYTIYSDGGSLLMENISPYERPTFRYPPIVAYMMRINHLIHPHAGKIIFVVFDAMIIREIHLLRKVLPPTSSYFLSWEWLWCFNPVSIYICTRGSIDSLSNYCLLACIRWLLEKKYFLSGIMLGFLIYFRIYPIIYSVSFLSYIFVTHRDINRKLFIALQYCCTVFTTTFLAIVHSFYMFGEPYLLEALYYHFIRIDHRHNFSIYYYYLYLQQSQSLSPSYSQSLQQPMKWLSTIPFIFQTMVLLLLPYRYLLLRSSSSSSSNKPSNLIYCLFLQTFVFILFNKVITGQYFLWIFIFIPFLPYPSSSLYGKVVATWQRLSLLCLSLTSVGLCIGWLYQAYALEFEGKNTMIMIWGISVIWFVVNVLLLHLFIMMY